MFRASARIPATRGCRPRLEALESRNLLSVCTVDRLTDNNPAGGGEGSDMAGDLRWCVIESLFRADTINFSVSGTVSLMSALPNLSRGVSIEGPGADFMTVRRNGSPMGPPYYRVFTVGNGAAVSISGLTISNGHTIESGAGIENSGMLTISNSIISGNSISFGSSGSGGGILNNGTLTINNCRLSSNSGNNSGGGIYNSGTLLLTNSTISGNSASFNGSGAGILNYGTLTVDNTTVAENSGTNSGGGIYHWNGKLTISNSAIASNHANNGGGGIYVSSAMLARNTIIAENTATAGPDVFGNLGSQGHNLIGNPQDMSGWVDTDLLHVNPRLGPLQNNGGATLTMALMPSSPALNSGDPAQLGSTDQRGVVRSGGVDIGAFQASASAFILAAPDSVPAGVHFDVDVTAVDIFGQVAVGYTGTVTFTTTDPDPGVVLPEDHPFTLDDGGEYTFTDTGRGETTLLTPGEQTLTVRDNADDTINGSAPITVGSTSPRAGRRLAVDLRLAAVSVKVPSPRARLAPQAASADRFFALLRREDFW